MRIIQLLASVFLGWSLGSNNSANMFGTAVSSQMVRWKTAAILVAIFATLGAILEGGEGLETYSKLSNQDMFSAFSISLAAALTAAVMTVIKIPVSTSQAVVGGIIGMAMVHGQFVFHGLEKLVICWVGTPIGAALIAVMAYPCLAFIIRRMHLHFVTYDKTMRTLLILAGIYGTYALGANNVANVTGVFYKAGAFDNALVGGKSMALLLGGASIALGALTYSKNVMSTVGGKIIKLDAFSAFVVVLSEAITVHIYAMVGVPVSTSQAVVGGVLGIGILKGMRTVSFATLAKIGVGWLVTPILGGVIAYGIGMLKG